MKNKGNIFLSILYVIAWTLTILSIFLIVLGICESCSHYECATWSAKSVAVFLSPHEKFYPIYGAWIPAIVAYLALKQYTISNTHKAIDFYYEKGVPSVNEI